MIWNRSEKVVNPEHTKFDDFLSQYDNEWYETRLGYLYDPETGNVSDTTVYHIINRNTGVIEYQGTMLPAVVQHANFMAGAMSDIDTAKHPPLVKLIN